MEKTAPFFYIIPSFTYNQGRIANFKDTEFHSFSFNSGLACSYSFCKEDGAYSFKTIKEFSTSSAADNTSILIGPITKKFSSDVSTTLNFIKSKSYIEVSYNDLYNFSEFIKNNEEKLKIYSLSKPEDDKESAFF